MNNKNSQTIYLCVDRHEKPILIDSILYAVVTDKLCTIHLIQGKPISIFLTLANILSMLPKKDFLQISRNCVVAMQYIQNVTDSAVVMIDGAELHYTFKKKSAILYAFQQNLTERSHQRESILWKLDFSSEFGCFDYCPFPFIILEVLTESERNSPSFICRYANDAMAALRHTPLNGLINKGLEPSLLFDEEKYIMCFADVAYNGRTCTYPAYHKATRQCLRIHCYQPHYGFCACLITHIEEEDQANESKRL